MTTPFRLLSFPFSPPTDDCQCFLYPSTWILSERGRGGFNGRLTVRGIIYSFLGWERLGILVKRYSPLPEEKKKETERERERRDLCRLMSSCGRIRVEFHLESLAIPSYIQAQLLFNPRGWYHVWLIKFLCRRSRLRSV